MPQAMPSKAVFQKILNVMEGAKYLQKKGWNDAQKYKFAQEADFIDLVKPLLEKEGLIVLPSFDVMETKDFQKGEGMSAKLSYRTTVHLTAEIVAIVDGSSVTVRTVGQGWDQQDKACYKAMTGAMKYLLAKTFLVPTGDDPEIVEAEPEKEKPKAEPKAPPKFNMEKFLAAVKIQAERLGQETYDNVLFDFCDRHKLIGSFEKWPEEQRKEFYRLLKETAV